MGRSNTMKLIFIISVFVLITIISGCVLSPKKNDNNGQNIKYTEDDGAQQQFLEYANQRLSEILDIAEVELEPFVAYLKENNLLEKLTHSSNTGRAQFTFSNEREEGLYPFSRRPIWIGDYPELSNIVEGIENRGIIFMIYVRDVSEADVFIEFGIRTEYTVILGMTERMELRYIEGNDELKSERNRHIRDNWYFYLHPNLHQSSCYNVE